MLSKRLGDLDNLIFHGLAALQESLTQDASLSVSNTAISVVGENHPFAILSNESLESHLKTLSERMPRIIKTADSAPDTSGADPHMDIETTAESEVI